MAIEPVRIGRATLYQGDCLEVMQAMDAESVHSIVTDPPYGLSFMGRHWDHGVPGEDFWAAALRVAKPGAHLLAFGGTRTFHRIAAAIEDAGWEIRDCVMWVYASGFPKSHDVSKAIDKAAGFERGTTPDTRNGPNTKPTKGDKFSGGYDGQVNIDMGAITNSAKQWQGWGTALKPAWEPIIVARKPLEGTVAANTLAHGTGGMNIDGCRVETTGSRPHRVIDPKPEANGSVYAGRRESGHGFDGGSKAVGSTTQGRWPANVIHDGSDEVVALFPETGGGGSAPGWDSDPGMWRFKGKVYREYQRDTGSAARFFYCAKASKKDRDEGLESAGDAVLARSCQAAAEAKRGNTVEQASGAFNKARIVKNNHPTVKPTDLMRYLCRLVTPPGGTVLDPFMGSGSTGKAALLEGFQFAGIEREAEYMEIARRRIDAAQRQGDLFAEGAA